MSGTALHPERHDGSYAFVTVPFDRSLLGLDVVATMREDEGLTLVLPEQQAIAAGFDVCFRCAWITLQVNSALDATGLTALFARALADGGIACNVVAGTHHDHLFVPVERSEDAVRILAALRW